MEIHARDDRRIDEAGQERHQGKDVVEKGPGMERGEDRVPGACLAAADVLAIDEGEPGSGSLGKTWTAEERLLSM